MGNFCKRNSAKSKREAIKKYISQALKETARWVIIENGNQTLIGFMRIVGKRFEMLRQRIVWIWNKKIFDSWFSY